VSQQELDAINAQLAQSNATLSTRRAAVADAKLNLERTVIVSPIDGIVLDRKTDKGRTVNASMNAPVLFTLVNNLTKMQINAAVAEADIGSIQEGQEVKFTVDAFPSRTFTGTVRQVRNAATANQSVVSYATIIDVNNEDLKLKPGMTANVSIIVQHKPNVLRIENGALRVRIPQELLPKPAASPAPAAGSNGTVAKGGKGGKSGAPVVGAEGAVATMTDDERMRISQEIMREVGFERGTPASPDQIARAKKLAKDKGLDPDLLAARLSTPGGRGRRGGGDGGGGGGSSGGSRRMSGGGSGSGDRGFNNTIVQRTLYRLVDPNAPEKKIEQVTARLGVSDGFYTEVLDGLNEGDVMIKGVTMPGAAPIAAGPSGGMQNPFQGGSRFGGSSGMRSR
jgi:HlyD family secretion protein